VFSWTDIPQVERLLFDVALGFQSDQAFWAKRLIGRVSDGGLNAISGFDGRFGPAFWSGRRPFGRTSGAALAQVLSLTPSCGHRRCVAQPDGREEAVEQISADRDFGKLEGRGAGAADVMLPAPLTGQGTEVFWPR
jgi:hypothetical protein